MFPIALRCGICGFLTRFQYHWFFGLLCTSAGATSSCSLVESAVLCACSVLLPAQQQRGTLLPMQAAGSALSGVDHVLPQ